MRRWLAGVIGGTLFLALAPSLAEPAGAGNVAAATITTEALAQGPMLALPPGKIYLSILEFRQQPGAAYGPHSHGIPTIWYTVHGIATFADPQPQALRPGAATFIPAGASLLTGENLEGRIGAGAIALALIVLVLLLSAATWLRGRPRRLSIAGLSILLIAGGVYSLIGVSTNDYYVMAVRPEAQRIGAMPRPDAHVFFASPDITPVPKGPYVETLSAIFVPAGARYDAPNSSGPQMILVTYGSATVQIGELTTQLSAGDATSAQAGQSLSIINRGSGTLRVLDFAVTSRSAPT
jgi:quercetin dioxygenase-like cupin family protein